MEKLQNWLRERCEENNLTWREASIQAGLNAGSVSAIMGGQKPGLETCKKLARLFRVSVIDILYWAGHVERLPANDPIFYDPRFQELAAAWQTLAALDDPEPCDVIYDLAVYLAEKHAAKED